MASPANHSFLHQEIFSLLNGFAAVHTI